MEWQLPKFRKDEVECMPAPTGQLAPQADAETVSTRIKNIDEAGENCRQKLNAIRRIFQSIERVTGKIIIVESAPNSTK
jgi:hypothetical protein